MRTRFLVPSLRIVKDGGERILQISDVFRFTGKRPGRTPSAIMTAVAGPHKSLRMLRVRQAPANVNGGANLGQGGGVNLDFDVAAVGHVELRGCLETYTV
jgi:hypothetical protein